MSSLTKTFFVFQNLRLVLGQIITIHQRVIANSRRVEVAAMVVPSFVQPMAITSFPARPALQIITFVAVDMPTLWYSIITKFIFSFRLIENFVYNCSNCVILLR